MEAMEYFDLILKGLLIPIIPLLANMLIIACKRWIESQKEKMNIDKANFYLDRIEDLIYESIMHTSKTYVDMLKQSGMWNREAYGEAFNKTKQRILELTKEEGRDIIEEIYEDYEKYIEIKIEQILKELEDEYA